VWSTSTALVEWSILLSIEADEGALSRHTSGLSLKRYKSDLTRLSTLYWLGLCMIVIIRRSSQPPRFIITAPPRISIPLQSIPWIALIFLSMRPILLEVGLLQPSGVCAQSISSIQVLTILSRCLHGSLYFLDCITRCSAGEKECHCCWHHLCNVGLIFSR